MSSSSTSTTSAPTTAPLPPYKQQSTLPTQPLKMDLTTPIHPSTTTRSSNQTNPAHQALFAGDIQLSAVSFSDVVTNEATGRKTVFVNYQEGHFPVLQTPWMDSWGVESSAKFAAPSSTEQPRLSLSVHLDSESTTQEHTDLKTFLLGVEDHMVRLGVEQSLKLFKKKALDNVTVREAMLNPLVRTNGKGNHLFKLHLNNYSKMSTVVQCHTGNAPHGASTVSHETIPPEDWERRVRGKMQVRAVFKMCPLYFIAGSNKFGCKCQVVSLEFRLKYPALRFDNYVFDTGAVPTTLNPSEITFTEVRVDHHNNKRVFLNGPGGGPLRVQTPWLTSYDGVSLPPAEYCKEGEPPKYSIQWSLKMDQPETVALRDALSALDERIIEFVHTHSLAIFKKNHSIHVVRSLYNPIMKPEYPSFKAKAPLYDDGWSFAAYNEQRERFTTDHDTRLKGRLQCRAIVQCRGLWFFGGRVGCNWDVKQLEYETPVAAGCQRYAFRDEGDVVMRDEEVEEDEDVVVDSDME